jgi:hypothetical protein
LANYLSAVLDRGTDLSRIDVFGLTHKDILIYLPVRRFVPKARSWEQLLARQAGEGNTKPFKVWLTNTFGCQYDDETMRSAAASLDHIPPEFYALIDKCRKMGGASEATALDVQAS